MTASPYDAPLSALREHIENLAVWLAVWEARTEPDARARRCAGDAVDAIDAALGDLHSVRARLVADIRAAAAAPADALLRCRGDAITSLGSTGARDPRERDRDPAP